MKYLCLVLITLACVGCVSVTLKRDMFIQNCAVHRPLVDCQQDVNVLYPKK